jgi:Fe-S-cluster containining protein
LAEGDELQSLLREYGSLLQRVDRWFARCSSRMPAGTIRCGEGCSGCCRGLFDITLLDACYLELGFRQLPEATKKAVLARVQDRFAVIQALWPDFSYPYLLNYRPEEEWDDVMPDEDETPCVLLDGEGSCLLYRFRPMTCRLHGIPLVDRDGEPFHDQWCSRNFEGVDPLDMEELRWEFRELFEAELALFRRFTRCLCGEEISELDTLIPAALLLDFRRL